MYMWYTWDTKENPVHLLDDCDHVSQRIINCDHVSQWIINCDHVSQWIITCDNVSQWIINCDHVPQYHIPQINCKIKRHSKTVFKAAI